MKDRAPNVRFVNRKAGLIVGQKQMYETTNGGLRWKSTELPAFDGLVQTTWFVPALHLAWIGGGTYVPADSGDGPNWTIKKYESGKWGILQPVVYFKNTTGPWIRSEVPYCDHSIIGLRFWDELRGVAVGDSCFYYTDTGGRRWETGVFHRGAEAISLFPYEGDEAPAFKPATFSWLDRNYGWASFDETLLYGTRDGGKNWSRIRSNAPYFECLVYYGPKFGIGIARGKLYQSSDSGITWNIIKTEFIPRSVYCSGKTACWVLSDTELYGLRVG